MYIATTYSLYASVATPYRNATSDASSYKPPFCVYCMSSQKDKYKSITLQSVLIHNMYVLIHLQLLDQRHDSCPADR